MLSEVLHVESVQKELGKRANKVFSPLLKRLSGEKKKKGLTLPIFNAFCVKLYPFLAQTLKRKQGKT